MTRKEQAIEIVRYGYSVQAGNSSPLVEANADPTVRGFGNAAIANVLEMLGGCGVVEEVMPTLGSGGIGFADRLNPEVVSQISGGKSIVDIVEDALGAHSTKHREQSEVFYDVVANTR